MSLKPVKYIQIDDEKGALYSAGKQSLLVPVAFVETVETTFVNLVGKESAEILTYKIGEALGRGYIQTLRGILKEENMEVAKETEIQMGCNAIFMEAGWGKVKIIGIDLLQKSFEVEILYSPSMEFLRDTRFSLEKGIVSGIYHEVTGDYVYCELIEEKKDTHSIVLRTIGEVPQQFKEKEKMALISRKELEDKNKRLEEAYAELKATQQQLIQSEKMATVGLLAAGVAHEINTPLGAILINAQRLLMHTEDDSHKKSLLRIKKSTEKCKTIIEQLLRYSRKSPSQFELVDLNQIIEDVLKLLEHAFNNENINVIKEFGKIARIEGNPTELSQVVTNILVNAKDAIKRAYNEERNSGVVTIITYQRENYVIAEIKDDGCGMPSANISKIFDPFFTTKDIGEGTGLGLSVVQRIVEAHKGNIEVDSKVGEGTVFRLTFPL